MFRRISSRLDLVTLDEGSDYTVVIRCGRATAEHYAAIVVRRSIAWAGPPDRAVADGERGIASAEFASALVRAGTQYVPPAA